MDPVAVQSETRFPCPSCGSDLRFDPTKGELHCDHCGHTEQIEGHEGPWSALKELDFESAIAAALPTAEIEETRVMHCNSCGAEVEFDESVHAKECPYCATPFVTGTGSNRHIKPRGVLPFALTETEARGAVGDWLGSLWFAPNGLQEYARKGRKMSGIYMPFWTFDAQTRSSYRGQRGTAYSETQTVTVNGKRQTRTVRKIRWSPKSGRVARFFDDVLVIASTSLPVKIRGAFATWDLSALEPYRPDYLAGFRAEAYTVELREGFVQAREYMDRVIERDVRFDIGGDAQRISSIETDVSDITFKHILLPIWIAAYKYRGESYRIIVNGRTGQVTGERPWSVWKIALAVAAGAIVAAGLGYLYALNEGLVN